MHRQAVRSIGSRRVLHWVLLPTASFALAACGGGSAGGDGVTVSSSSSGNGTAALSIEAMALPASVGELTAEPTFHLAPVLLPAPDDADALDNAASAHAPPRTQSVPAGLAGLPTRGLTVQAVEQAGRARALGAGSAAPQAAATAISTYSPAQIRAAYGLPALPASGSALSAAQAAQLGAGQTIYIVDAKHDPNLAAELSAFNQKFGLPGCTPVSIAPAAGLPLAAAKAGDGCTLSVVYSTAAGGMTGTAPAYDAGWATEITLDVQWAHATAPLARIVLIEAADASLNNLLGGVKLANAMGPGIVSMSFGATEGSWTASVDSAFAGAGMTYLAATGDAGSQVSWPAVSPKVLAVGGTTLSYGGSGTRSEIGWAKTGGGISAYTATPAYQNSAVPGIGSLAHRAVADVAFNADPSTGQFVAVLPQGSSTPSWVSAGGTSLSTPQWAGLLAVANATRALSGKTVLGAPHGLIYGQIGAVPGNYAAAFADITSGSNGSCATCSAASGYDLLTGLGTPNATALLGMLTDSSTVTITAAQPPVISAPALSGVAGKALSGTIGISDPGGYAMNISIGGVPRGVSFSLSGSSVIMNWPSPVAGNYNLSITATDAIGLSSQATLAVAIAAK